MEVIKDLPTEPELPVLESYTSEPTEVALASSGPEFETLVSEPIVQPAHVSVAWSGKPLVEDSSSEPRFSVQPTPINVESSPPVPFHTEQTIAMSHLMDLDDSCASFISSFIKGKTAEVAQAIVTRESPLVH